MWYLSSLSGEDGGVLCERITIGMYSIITT